MARMDGIDRELESIKAELSNPLLEEAELTRLRLRAEICIAETLSEINTTLVYIKRNIRGD